MVSYIVKPESVRLLCNVMEENMKCELDMPIDLFIRQKAREGIIRVGCIFPFLTSVLTASVFDSLIGDERDQFTDLAYMLARASFFLGRDLNQLYEHLKRLQSTIKPDTHADLLAGIQRLALSDKWRPF